MTVSRRIIPLVIGLVAISVLLSGLKRAPVQAQGNSTIYLPLVLRNAGSAVPRPQSRSPWFGAEVHLDTIGNSKVTARLQEFGGKWLRLGPISWRSVQPTQGGSLNWGALGELEAGLARANEAGLTPIVVVTDSPAWATIDLPHPPFKTSCAAIREDRFADFAAFMSALAARYKGRGFNVHHWELFNEPDVDPQVVPVDNPYGCWGNRDDYFYGGEHYGRMLSVVTPAIKQADPGASVLIGGLLLNSPNTPSEAPGVPERFFEGILVAGGAQYFDIVSYHAYGWHYGVRQDHSGPAFSWTSYGGFAKGKPTFLHEVMSRYGVSKPIFLTETALGCPPCGDTTPEFLEDQADFVPRTFVRTLSAGANAILWYTLDGPGWRQTGLLNGAQDPRPAYSAYQQLIAQTAGASLPPSSVDYGGDLEAYRFNKGSRVLDVVWSLDFTPDIIRIPQSQFIAAYGRDGGVIRPTFSDGNVEIPVGFSAVYIHRQP